MRVLRSNQLVITVILDIILQEIILSARKEQIVGLLLALKEQLVMGLLQESIMNMTAQRFQSQRAKHYARRQRKEEHLQQQKNARRCQPRKAERIAWSTRVIILRDNILR